MKRAFALLALALFLASPDASAQGGPPAASVRVDAVKQETVGRQRNVTGEIRPSRRSNVASETAGRVIEVNVEVGDTAKAGAVIAKLDDTLARIEVTRREAELASAAALIREREALVTQAQRDVDRVEALRTRNSASQSELDDALTDLETARAQLARAEADRATRTAELEQARENLNDLTIRAPFGGSIVGRDIELGQWIDEGETAIELIELDRVDVFLDVPEAFIGLVAQMERPISMSLADGRITREAPLTAIVDDADPEARTFPVRIRMENADRALRPGMSVTGVVPTGEMTSALTVHKDAVLRDDAGSFVYFVADGKAMPARISTLYAIGNRVAVRAGQLNPGMNLIIEGNERLYPTQPVTIVGGNEVADASRTSRPAPGEE